MLAERGLCPSAVVAKVGRVKKEVVVKSEDGAEEAVGSADVVEERNVKAEDVEPDAVPDIEDLGTSRSSRPRRL